MATYDPNKAATFNQLRQQGLSEEAAAAQAGITEAESGNYTIGLNGQMGPVIAGTGRATTPLTAADRAESARFEAGLTSPSNFEQVDFSQTANSQPGTTRPVTYTTTSTETVSGGGTRTVTAGERQPTAASTALGAAYDAKNAEYNEFVKNNPSNFQRRRLGLPLMGEQEQAAYNQRLQTLNQEKEQLKNAQIDAEAGGTPTVTFTPNTTTTTVNTVTTTVAPQAAQNSLNPQNDEAVFRQTEAQIGSSTPALPTSVPAPDPTAPAIVRSEIGRVRFAQPVTETAQPAATTIQGLANEEPVFVQRTIDPALGEGPLTVQATAAAPLPLPPDLTQDQFDDRPPVFEPGEIGDEDPDVAQEQELRRAIAQADIANAYREPEPVLLPDDLTQDQFDENPIDFPADVGSDDPETQALLEQQQAIARADIANVYREPEPVPEEFTGYGGASFDEQAALNNALRQQEAVNTGPSRVSGFVNNAKNQSTLQARVNQPSAADWRVRLSLAPNANYLYKDSSPGILAPLAATDGVIFPYTPAIETAYKAKYNAYDLIHSNYRGYFYQNSSVDEISVKGTFTAQDTREAAYLLAVIHFFRSVTKMFYGQDAQAGAPPPLCYLTGLGQYQFNKHPCLVSSFNYSLPTDVDYIRANGFNNIGLNLENRRNQSSGPGIAGTLGTVVAIVSRLANSGLKNGSEPNRPSNSQVNQNVTNQNSVNSTYVPTKMDISITLLPVQTRNQISKQFSLKDFANGNQLKGGFW